MFNHNRILLTSKRSQTGFEFLIISGAVFFFFTIFFIAINSNIEDKNREKENLIIRNLALSVQEEINLATKSSDGYSRTFSVPSLILGKNYDIEITDNSVYIKTDRNALSLQIGDVIGDIKRGDNLIKKENGDVKLNQ